MNYRAFFTNHKRQWWRASPGVYRTNGYILSLDPDPRHHQCWNLYQFDRSAPDCWACIAHNIPHSAIPDTLTDPKE